MTITKNAESFDTVERERERERERESSSLEDKNCFIKDICQNIKNIRTLRTYILFSM